MPRLKSAQQLRASLLSTTPGIFLLSNEDALIDRLLASLPAEGLVQQLIEWHPLQGWLDGLSHQPLGLPHSPRLEQDLCVLEQHPLQRCLIIIRRIHLAGGERPAVVTAMRLLLDRIAREQPGQSAVLLIDEQPWLPAALGTRLSLLVLPRPDPQEIDLLIAHAERQGLQLPTALRPPLLAALRGLNASEILQLLRQAVLRGPPLDEQALQQVRSCRQQQIAHSGLLQLIEPGSQPERLCGLENLRLWLEQRARIFQHLEEAHSRGVATPRALLIAGMPGCGKSTSARLAARLFDMPLLRLDTDALVASDNALQLLAMRPLLQAMSPCILWIDALEQGFRDAASTRTLRQLFDWVLTQAGHLFLLATANDLANVPDDLLHRNHFDEMFHVGLPACRERRLIIEYWLREGQHCIQGLDLDELAELTIEFSGADLVSALGEAATRAFLDNSPLNQPLIAAAIRNTIPLRDSLHEQFSRCEQLCQRLKLHPASLQDGPALCDMYRMVSDPSHLQRLQVARSADAPQALLERLADDPHNQVRRAVLNNPRCPQALLSQRINIRFGAPDYDGMLLAQACCHRNSPVDLVVSLFTSDHFHPDREALQLIAANTRHAPLHLLLLEAGKHWPRQRTILWRDYARLRYLLAGNPDIGELVQLRLASDDNWSVRRRLAQHPSLHSAAIRLLAGYKDMLIDDALSRNPALHGIPQLRLLEALDVYEFVPLSQIQPVDPQALHQCTRGDACICQHILHLAPEEPLLLRPHQDELQPLFSEPWLIIPLSPRREFRCPEQDCGLDFTYTRTLAPPVAFTAAEARLSYCPHVFRA